MRIRMNTDREAAPDGITIVELVEDGVYDVREELGRSYIERGFAELADGEELSPPLENNAGAPPPENELGQAPPENGLPAIDLENATYAERLAYYNDHLRPADQKPFFFGTRRTKLDAAIEEALRHRQEQS